MPTDEEREQRRLIEGAHEAAAKARAEGKDVDPPRFPEERRPTAEPAAQDFGEKPSGSAAPSEAQDTGAGGPELQLTQIREILERIDRHLIEGFFLE